MSNKKINIDTLNFIEELSDEEVTAIVGGASSATPTATPSSTSVLGNAKSPKNTPSNSSTTKLTSYSPNVSDRQH